MRSLFCAAALVLIVALATQSRAAEPRNVKQPPNRAQILAQQFPAQQGANPRRLPPAAARQRALRGPAGFGFAANGAGAAAQPMDNGPALVDLIQRTIEPPSWDINGGPGSIVYFRQPRVLVVRQRSEVHQQLQDVVRGLRQ